MKPIDWNATAAWIALAVSIITPTVSLFINNRHQRKLKQLELLNQKATEFYSKQCDVFTKYLRHVTNHVYSISSDFFEYNTSYHELFMYVPQEHWSLLTSLDAAIKSKDKQKIEPLYLEVTKTLALILQEQQKQIPV